MANASEYVCVLNGVLVVMILHCVIIIFYTARHQNMTFFPCPFLTRFSLIVIIVTIIVCDVIFNSSRKKTINFVFKNENGRVPIIRIKPDAVDVRAADGCPCSHGHTPAAAAKRVPIQTFL